ncbi:MAG TPA: hypothetical protein DCE42_21150 [Myxococcales bacterium]|nr:hypothetical protein [Deltaproteobacteria bacterium]MBK07414.1 hypothetical protein [Deltaproteobacteria bacterium]MBU48849.1 hypothetical protein [Deltaproteobacteria bacterium]HAA57287.1 hypothetical protein [Myxococcales bacterium]|tara:strand:+ start:380 stop:1162 length:783 start_codon:yes stop_codon:yes gene_type:complete
MQGKRMRAERPIAIVVCCVVFLCLNVPGMAWSCMYAQQHRLIPLGLHKGKLVALELAVFRRSLGKGPLGLPLRWEGKAWFRYFDKRGRMLSKKKFFSRVSIRDNNRYKSQLAVFVKRALRRLKLRKAKKIVTHYCRFRKRCDGLQMIKAKKSAERLILRYMGSHSKKTFRVGKRYMQKLSDAKLKTDTLRFQFRPLNRIVVMQIHHFSASERFLLVQISKKPSDISSPKWKPLACRNVGSCLLLPGANHHGASIDFIGKL